MVRKSIKEADLALLSPPLPTSPSSKIPDKVIMAAPSATKEADLAALSPPQQKRAKLDLDLVLPPGATVLDIIVASHSASSLRLCLWVEEDNAKGSSLMNTWKDIIECAVCREFMIGPGRAPQICGICYCPCCSRCVLRQNREAQLQMEVPRCPISNCANLGAYCRSLALQEIADTLVRSGQVEVAPCLEDLTDSSTSIPRPVAPALVTQMAQMTVDALGLQQRQWEQKFLEEIKREKRNSQARRSRAKKRLGGDSETGRDGRSKWAE